jgi:glycosyltransferase involved in cell wall biosynthesis
MKKSLISCIVPVFNGERYLGESLDSIFEQTYRPLQVIVVDDGSADRTAEIGRSYGSRILLLQQPNGGSAAAKNQGISVAEGEYIAFLDADDVWHPDKLARQIARLRERSEIDLCFTRFENFWMPELAEEERLYRNSPLAQPQGAWSIGTLLTHSSTFEKFGLFDDGLRGNENMIWFLRAAGQEAVIELLPDVLMRRRFHLGNDTRRGSAHATDLLLPIVKAWRDYQRQRSAAADCFKPLPKPRCR